MASIPATQLAISFSLILERFKAQLSAHEKADFQFTTLEDLRRELKKIQNKHVSERKQMWMGRLNRFLEAMGEYDKVIQVFVNPSQYLAFVWGPMKFLLVTASTYADGFNNVLDAYHQIGDNLPLLVQYKTYFEENPQMGRILALVYEDLLEFHLKAMRYFKQKMWKTLIHALWKNFQMDFGVLLEQLRRHQHLVETQASILHFEESLRIREAAERHLHESREVERRRQTERVRSWLTSPNMEADQQKYATVREETPGSGSWILSDPKFRSWFDPDFCFEPLLWINGIPGAGKTVLASTIVEEARKLTLAVAFFYCKYQDPDRNSFLPVARSLLSQLVHQKDTLLPYIYDSASQSGQATLTTISLAENLLNTCLKSFEVVYIILDGLDECDDGEQRKHISRVLKSIVESLPAEGLDSHKVRCVFISQDDSVARKDFAAIPSLRIDAEGHQKDIAAYVQVQCRKIQEEFHLSDEKIRKLAVHITDQSEEMFLFARLVTQNLLQQVTVEDFECEIGPDLFPSGGEPRERLNRAYDRIFNTTFDKSRGRKNDHALRLLGWLVCARRPLRWNEIQGAVSVDIEASQFNWENRKLRQDSKELCGSLVEIRSDHTIELVHRTAKRYLIDNRKVNLTAQELRIANLCISYLNLLGSEDESEWLEDGSANIDAKVRSGYYAFLDYAIAYWCRHLEAAAANISEGDDNFRELSESVDVFLQLHWIDSKSEIVIPRGLRNRLQAFQNQTYFDKLTKAITTSNRRLVTYGKPFEDDDVLDLSTFLQQIRARQEELALDQECSRELQEFYGRNQFKCPRMSCIFFYQGFDDKERRNQHIARHDRMYFCSFPGCPMSDALGCISETDLRKHENEKHNGLINDLEFPDPNLDKEERVFTCDECGSQFTRRHNLNLHVRIHKEDKSARIGCRYCDKTFGRQGDRTRHESTQHVKGKEFHCGGELEDGTAWGCGKVFNRAENLARHYKSKKGSRCVPPGRDMSSHPEREDDENEEEDEEENSDHQELTLSQATTLVM